MFKREAKPTASRKFINLVVSGALKIHKLKILIQINTGPIGLAGNPFVKLGFQHSLRIMLLFLLGICTSTAQDEEAVFFPNCDSIESLLLARDDIIASDDRFLFSHSKDTIEGLYCQAIQDRDLEMEALCLLKMSDFQPHWFTGFNQFRVQFGLLNRCLKLATEHNFEKIAQWTRVRYATILTSNGMYKEAESYVLAYLANIERKDSLQMTEAHMIYGRLLRDWGKFDRANEALEKSISLQPKELNHRLLAYSYLHLANASRLQGFFDQCIEKANIGMKSAKLAESQSTALQYFLANELILANLNQGETKLAADLMPLIKNYAEIDLFAQLQLPFLQGMIFQKQDSTEQAIQHFSRALKMAHRENADILVLQIMDRLNPILSTSGDVSVRADTTLRIGSNAYNSLISKNEQDNLFRSTYLKLQFEE